MSLRVPSIRSDDYDSLAALCKAANDPLRLDVLRTLANDSFGVLELAWIFAIGQSGMSHHLKVLAQAGLVTTHREGNTVFYRRSLPLTERTGGALHTALLEEVDERALPDDMRARIDAVHTQCAAVNQGFFARMADKFQAQQNLIAGLPQYRENVLTLLDALVSAPGATALEVGPGDSGFLSELARCFRQVAALDNSAAMLELARRRCKEEGLGNVRLELTDALQDAAEPADCVVLDMVLHHFAVPAEVLKQLVHLVHPGGSLLVTDLYRHSQGWARETCGDLWLGFEQEDLAQWTDAAGFTSGGSLYIGLRNGFQIQVRHFARGTSESRLTHRQCRNRLTGECSVFISESVSEDRPGKIAGRVSDTMLGVIIAKNKYARVAYEILAKTGMAIIADEVTTSAWVDLEELVRKVIIDIGYDSSDVGFDGATCGVLNIIGKQSVDISQGVDRVKPKDQGTDDQGLMFGYANNETDMLMPMPICLSHRLVERQAEARKSGLLPWLRPDTKSQVTCRYKSGKAVGIDAVVLSTQHSPGVSYNDLRDGVMELIIKQVLPAELLHKDTQSHISPTGNLVIDDPVGDCGLTGCKIIVGFYGDVAHHGDGAFSGKDSSKVDRSTVYAGRHVAKNIVVTGLAKRCEVQVSYAVDMTQPTLISINTFDIGEANDEKIAQLVREHLDLRPYVTTKILDLLHPMCQPITAYGHFGRHPFELTVDGDTFTTFTWEKTDKAALLRDVVGL